MASLPDNSRVVIYNHDIFIIQATDPFYRTSYHYEEVHCTEPSRQLVFPRTVSNIKILPVFVRLSVTIWTKAARTLQCDL